MQTLADGAARNGVLALAQVELGGILIGIPAACVVRAMQRPATLAQVPRSGVAIDGVFSVDGHIVPVVDLRRWMHGGDASGTPPHVMVLQVEGRSVGLAVDAIRGIARVPAARVRKVHHDDAAEELFDSVATLDDGVSLISVLDPARLMGQVQVWAPDAHQGPDAALSAGASSAGGGSSLFALVRIAGKLVAVDARHAGEVLHQPPVQPLDLGGSDVAGILCRRGEQVPLLACACSLGLPRTPAGAGARLVLLLSEGSRSVALPIDAVHAVQPVDIATVQPAQDAGMAEGGYFTGVARTRDGQTLLLLDSARLLATYAVPGLSGADATAAHGAGKRDADALSEAHIVVDLGQEWAIRMSSVHAIAPLPDDFAAVPAAQRSVIGSAGWRGRSLPVLDLRGGRANVDRRRARMVVVQHGTHHAALLADELTALLPSNAATRSRFKPAGGDTMEMLTVGAARERKSYRVLDLGTLPFFADAPA